MRAPDHGLWSALWLSAVAASAGCSAPQKLVSARHTSCPLRELEIRDLVSAPSREDWIAVCRERSFACWTREKGRRLIYGCRPLADAGPGDAALSGEAQHSPESTAMQSAHEGGDARSDASVEASGSAHDQNSNGDARGSAREQNDASTRAP